MPKVKSLKNNKVFEVRLASAEERNSYYSFIMGTYNLDAWNDEMAAEYNAHKERRQSYNAWIYHGKWGCTFMFSERDRGTEWELLPEQKNLFSHA